MNILITAIGAMSAECVIRKLKEQGHIIIGCDIYPSEWHYESILCDFVYQSPYATNNEYIKFLLYLSEKHNITHLIPLTDLEIDVINTVRNDFDTRGITLCMQEEQVLSISRNKYELYNFFLNDKKVPSIKTYHVDKITNDLCFPCVVKPYNGRSSEGLMRNVTKEQLGQIVNKDLYIVQEQKDGPIFTVDYCRSALYKTDCAIPREELLRTKNGAGLTIRTTNSKELINLASYIGNRLNVNGCVNMEFILNEGKYYLIDINPRFSAGAAFSIIAGYDMVNNHMSCFSNEEIDCQIEIKECVMLKRYDEIIMK